jgi:hypothetical protein
MYLARGRSLNALLTEREESLSPAVHAVILTDPFSIVVLCYSCPLTVPGEEQLLPTIVLAATSS